MIHEGLSEKCLFYIVFSSHVGSVYVPLIVICKYVQSVSNVCPSFEIYLSQRFLNISVFLSIPVFLNIGARMRLWFGSWA